MIKYFLVAIPFLLVGCNVNAQSLWNKSSAENGSAGSVQIIAGGPSSVTINGTSLVFFDEPGCGVTGIIGTASPSASPSFTMSVGQTRSVNAASIYTIAGLQGITQANIRAVALMVTNEGQSCFTGAYACLIITNACAGGECEGSTVESKVLSSDGDCA